MTFDLDPDAVLWNTDSAGRDGKPLLVLMHGRGSDENDLFGLVPALPAEFVVASVRAPIAEFEGWSWWDTVVPGDPDAELVDASASAVLRWLDSLPFTPSAVGAMGFSQGGAMAMHLLRRAVDRIPYAVNLSGFAIGGTQQGDAALAVSRPPLFWGRGAEDPLFTPEIIARTDSWIAGHTAATVRVYPDQAHSVSAEEFGEVAAFLRARL